MYGNNFGVSLVLLQTGYMFNMSPEKFTEIAENLDPDKPLHVSRILCVYNLFVFLPDKLNTCLEFRILPKLYDNT